MNAHSTRTRMACLFAAIAMTAISVGSQLGLVNHYTSEADALLAAQKAPVVAQRASESVVTRAPS